MIFVHGHYSFKSVHGILENPDPITIQEISKEIKEKGYFIKENALSKDFCERLLNFALQTPCLPRPMNSDNSNTLTKEKSLFHRGYPKAVRYDYARSDVLNNPDVQKLLSDPSILALAQNYLGTKPIADVIGMWWHTDFGHEPDEEAAQYFHFDLDRIKWIKLFFYMTDVTSETGPHTFVPGTHKTGGIPQQLRKKGYARLKDEEVARFIPASEWKTFSGNMGTLIIEDTRGLHKGNQVIHGDRLVLQIQFSDSLFGADYPKVSIQNIIPEFETATKIFRNTYKGFL